MRQASSALSGGKDRERAIEARYSSDFIKLGRRTLITARDFRKKSRKHEPKHFIFAGTSPGLLERPLLYMVVVENDEVYGNDFFKANECSGLFRRTVGFQRLQR